MDIHNSAGELLTSNDLYGYGRGNGYPAHRGDLAEIFYRHLLSLGIECHLGKRITEYWEDDQHAGIIVDGVRISADCVIASDGVHSKARGSVTGADGTPHSSGYAMYRAWFSADGIKADPKTKWLTDLVEETGNDQTHVFIGTDIHCMIGTAKKGKEVFWMCTHRVSMKYCLAIMIFADLSLGCVRHTRVMVIRGQSRRHAPVHSGLEVLSNDRSRRSEDTSKQTRRFQAALAGPSTNVDVTER